jgi:menaquinone-dependent protoporphyrinogen oxidase
VKRVLIVYASCHGSTREIAEWIAARLSSRGVPADCVPVARAREVDRYDAVVLGSAIHNQAWLPEAVRFTRNHEATLTDRPVWLFSVGVPAALAPALRGWARREGPKVTEPLRTKLHARGDRLFSGVFTPAQVPLASRILLRLLGGHGGDFRDRPEIEGWADEIMRDLVTGDAATAPPSC